MAYFNHAFQKAFLADTVAGAPLPATGIPVLSQNLDSGEFAVLDGETYNALDAAGIAAFSGSQLMLAQGSFHTADVIGNNPGHGGYMESTKSKGINPKYINKIWHTCCVDLTCATLVVEACGDCFVCGTDPTFRLDVKGSPALRFLNHNAYSAVDIGGYCCDAASQYIDPVYVLCTWAKGLIHDPIVTPFVQIIVESSADGGTTWSAVDCDTYTPTGFPGILDCAKMTITGCYVDTKFGNCSFDTRDHYNKEPVQLVGSVIDDSGDPCLEECVDITSTPGTMAETSGETVIRDILLTEQYMQNPYNQGNKDSARIREIEGSDQVLAAVDRTALYDRWYLLHSVPRFNNPTGVFDNDQYLYTVSSLCDSVEAASVATLLDAIAALAEIEVLEDCPTTS